MAADVTLTHKNSTAEFNLSGAGAGVVSWSIDGVHNLGYQGSFFRIGATPEASIGTISAPVFTVAQVANVISKLDVTYANSILSVNTLYQLTGSTVGSGKAGLSESITVKNLSGAPLDLHFFQYSDFNLSGTSGGQTAQFGFDALMQPFMVTQTDGTRTLTATLNANAAPIGHFQADFASATLISLTDLAPTVLGDVSLAGPGNVTFAYQWDVTLAPNGTLTISKLMNIVPEPGIASMLLVMGALMAVRRGRKNLAGK